jgi:hypothetical protein
MDNALNVAGVVGAGRGPTTGRAKPDRGDIVFRIPFLLQLQAIFLLVKKLLLVFYKFYCIAL